MLESDSFFMELEKYLQLHNIINISGEAGTGKTTLALYLVGNILTQERPFHSQCMWVQASEFFPTRRLTQLFKKESDKLYFLRNNIYITPPKRPFLSYKEQTSYFLRIKELYLPPELKIILIDNISHHLRHSLSNYSNISNKVRLLNRFYEQQIMPLILLSQQEHIILMLIHEVSYDPKLDKIIPFFNKLYSRIESIDLYLEKDKITTQKYLSLNYLAYHRYIPYEIQDEGFKWIRVKNNI